MHLDPADGAFQDRQVIAERHPELYLERHLSEAFLQPGGNYLTRIFVIDCFHVLRCLPITPGHQLTDWLSRSP